MNAEYNKNKISDSSKSSFKIDIESESSSLFPAPSEETLSVQRSNVSQNTSYKL